MVKPSAMAAVESSSPRGMEERARPLRIAFAVAATAVIAVAVSLDGFGSMAPVTVAVFTTTPALAVLTTRVTVPAAPLPIVPRLQDTGAVPLHVPWVGVAETKVRPAGRASVSVTFVAAA